MDGKKVCGILIENTSGYFIIGIGININSDTAQQREIANNATSLRLATGRYFERESIIAGVIRAFEEHTHQFSKDRTVLFDKWKNSLLIPEGDIELVSSGEKFHGRVTGISPAGSLEFRTTDGHHLSFNSVESY